MLIICCFYGSCEVAASPLRNHGISVSTCRVLPTGLLGENVNPATGFIANYTVRNLLFSNQSMGFQAGYWNLPGKEERLKSITIVPILCTMGLRIPVFSSISIEPWIGTGGSYISTEAAQNIPDLSINGYTKETAFNLTCAGGGILHWRPGHYFSIDMGASYYSIFENESRFNELVISIGAGFRIGSSAGIEALKDEGHFTLKEKENDYTINLIYARFDFNSTSLTNQLTDEIDQNLSLFIENTQHTYTIIGHSDRKGTPQVRKEISITRAEKVKDYLVTQYNIDPDKIQCKGKGATDPIVHENSKKTMAMNRRITIIIHTGE